MRKIMYFTVMENNGVGRTIELTADNYKKVMANINEVFSGIDSAIEVDTTGYNGYSAVSKRVQHSCEIVLSCVKQYCKYGKIEDMGNYINKAISNASNKFNVANTAIRDKITIQIGINTDQFRLLLIKLIKGDAKDLFNIMYENVSERSREYDKRYLIDTFKAVDEMIKGFR